jgi:hypothetical protein
MIEHITYDDDTYMIVADEPTEQLKEILHTASVDKSHPLSSNYTNINMNRFAFYNVAVHNNVPMMFFGTERSSWMPSGVARALTRFYKHPSYRPSEMWSTQKWMMRALDYDKYDSWLTRHNIRTLIMTRNVGDKNDATRYLTRVGWNAYPHICRINRTSQHVYWRGDESLSFLTALHESDEPPTRIE